MRHLFALVAVVVGGLAGCSDDGGPKDAPDTVLDSSPSALTNQTKVSFTFHATSNANGFVCSIDGGTPAPCLSGIEVTVGDGMHTFEVSAALNNLIDETPAMATWKVDATPPDTQMVMGPPALDNTVMPQLEFAGTDPGGGAVTFECKLDAATYAPCTSPNSFGVTDGLHTFTVRAVDAAGNVDPTPAAHEWTVDSSTPDTMITVGPAGGATTTPDVSFTFGSPASGVTYECSLDGGAFVPCSSPQAYINLPDGMHTFTVRAKTAAGTIDPSPATRTWTVDGTAPTVTITARPGNPSNDSTPTFSFTSNDATARFECAIDTGAFVACTSAFTTAALADGMHTFRVRAKDPVGNTSTVATYTWVIDTMVPTVMITGGPSGMVASANASFTFTTAGSPTIVECALDTGAFAACTSPRAYSALADGAHTFTVRVRDAAGNTGMDMRMFTVDTMAPTVMITAAPTNPTGDNTPTFMFTTAGAPTLVQCSLDGGAFAACTSPFTTAALGDGSHAFVVRATDAVGNSGTDMRTFTVDTAAPTVTIVNRPTNPSNSAAAAFTFTASEGSPQCSIDGGAFAACTSPRNYTGLADGSHTFTVRSADALGNTGMASYTWTIDTAAPTVTINTRPAAMTNLTTANFTFTVSDGTIQCQLDGGAFAACSSPRTYTGLTAGSHTFVVRSTDSANNVGSASYTWTIDLTPPTITITGPASPSPNRNPSLSFTVSEGSPQCRLDTASFAACTSPVSYLNLGDGSHTFSVTTTDAAGNPATASHTWTIDGTGPVVTFSSVPPARWPVNYYDFAWSANESATYECSINGGTTWVACSTPFGIPNAAAMFPPATYGVNNTFSVRGRDSLNNLGAAVTHTWAPVAGLVLHFPFEQGERLNTSLLAQRAAYSPGVAGVAPAVGGWAGTALRNAVSTTYAGTRRPLTSSSQGVYMGGMWVREFNDMATGTLWTNVDSSGLWGHTVTVNGSVLRLTVLENGQSFTVQGTLPFNVWAHVGVRTTGVAKGLELTVNGATVAHARPPSATGFEADQGDLRIGQMAFLDIDDVRFYNTLVDTCATFVRGQIPPSGGPCVANAPALEFDFEGGRLDETGTMSIGRSNPLWTAFVGRLGEGFKLASPQVPFDMTNFNQQQPLLGYTLALWAPGSGQADTLFDFTTACSFAANLGTCGLAVVWTDNRQFRIFAGVPGLTSAHQQDLIVPASSLSATQTHNLVIAEQRTANGTQSIRIYVDGRLEATMTFGNGDVFAIRSNIIRSCTQSGCSVDEIELWPRDLSANAEMLCENGFDGQWDPVGDRCRFTSND